MAKDSARKTRAKGAKTAFAVNGAPSSLLEASGESPGSQTGGSSLARKFLENLLGITFLLSVAYVVLIAVRMDWQPVIVLKPGEYRIGGHMQAYIYELQNDVNRRLQNLPNASHRDWQSDPLNLLPRTAPTFGRAIEWAEPSLTGLLQQSIEAFLRYVLRVRRLQIKAVFEEPALFKIYDEADPTWQMNAERLDSTGATNAATKHAVTILFHAEPEAELRSRWTDLTHQERIDVARRELACRASLVAALVLIDELQDSLSLLNTYPWSRDERLLLSSEAILRRQWSEAFPDARQIETALNELDQVAKHNQQLKSFALARQAAAFLRLAKQSTVPTAYEWAAQDTLQRLEQLHFDSARFYLLALTHEQDANAENKLSRTSVHHSEPRRSHALRSLILRRFSSDKQTL